MSIAQDKLGTASRRKFIAAAAVGALGVSGGVVYTIASRRGGNAKESGKEITQKGATGKGAVGERLPIPNEPMIDSIHFSPVDDQFAVVAGDMMSKRLYVAEFPPQSADDYQVLADLPNCIGLAAPTWCRDDPNRMAFLATVIPGDKTAPPVTDQSEWQRVLEEMGVTDANVQTKFSGGLYTISRTEQAPEKVCAVKPLPDPGASPGTAWIDPTTIISSEGTQIRRYRLQGDGKSAEMEVLLEANRDTPGMVQSFRYLAYHPGDNLLVTLRNSVREQLAGNGKVEYWTDALMFDQHGEVQKESRIDPASSAEAGPSQFLLGKNGETYLKSTTGVHPVEQLFVGSVANGPPREIPFDSAMFTLMTYGMPDGQMVFMSRDAGNLEDRYYVGAI